MKRLMSIVGLGALACTLTGCETNPARFLESSAPIPPKGYTVLGEEVTGTCKQIWILGLGGSSSPQQTEALHDAIEDAPEGTDALISMSIEEHLFTFLIYTSKTTSVTGVPVKFNK